MHIEKHKLHRIGWLRAAVLGANDGIISTASLLLGIIASGANIKQITIAGVAALVAGAMSMAAGEYVSVSSQEDTEKADIERERKELIETPEKELQELTNIYVKRGLTQDLAKQVAIQLTEYDALGTHKRDELGIIDELSANPVQAALTSAAMFAFGSILPLLMIFIFPLESLQLIIPISSLFFLGLLGYIASYAGGSKVIKSITRVMLWGTLAMIFTYTIGYFVNI